jgi:hypothetical protein
MPELCSRCGKTLSPAVRFCEECGAPADRDQEPVVPPYIPLLELHTGMLGTGRSVAVMQVSPDELTIFTLPEYFIDAVEELRERLDDAWLKVSDAGGDWKKTLDAWNWESESVISGLEEIRDDLVQEGKSVRVIMTGDIRSVLIERIESDTVWDIMTIDVAGKKFVIDLVGPVAGYAFRLLKAVLGDRIEYRDE